MNPKCKILAKQQRHSKGTSSSRSPRTQSRSFSLLLFHCKILSDRYIHYKILHYSRTPDVCSVWFWIVSNAVQNRRKHPRKGYTRGSILKYDLSKQWCFNYGRDKSVHRVFHWLFSHFSWETPPPTVESGIVISSERDISLLDDTAANEYIIDSNSGMKDGMRDMIWIEGRKHVIERLDSVRKTILLSF